jgi:hypothetical protein
MLSISTAKAPKRPAYVVAPIIITSSDIDLSMSVYGKMSPYPILVIVAVAQNTASIYSSNIVAFSSSHASYQVPVASPAISVLTINSQKEAAMCVSPKRMVNSSTTWITIFAFF